MNNTHFKRFLLGICLFFTTFLIAQKSGLDSMIIINTGEYKPSVVDANKINNTPLVKDSTKKLIVKNYNIYSKKMEVPFNVTPVTPAQMVGEPLTKLYNMLAKAGFGNYTTPYFEFWYNNLRSKEYAYGARLKHLSSSATIKEHGFAGYSDNEVNIYAKKFLKEHTLLGNFDYTRNTMHFYGYNPDSISLSRKQTAQYFNYFAANAELLSHYSRVERVNHQIKLNYYNLADFYNASENNINATGYVQAAILNELLKVNAGVDFYNHKTANDTANNTIISLNPNFIATGKKYSAAIGIKAMLDVTNETKFYFYPNVDLSYNIFDNIIVPYAGANGGLQRNSLKIVTDENPFVLSQLTLKNSNTKFNLYGGLRGTLSSYIAYNARASYSSVDNMLLYVNDTVFPAANRFNVIYDHANVLNIHGEINYQLREKLRIFLGGDYFNYKMKQEIRAWYKPQLKINFAANYNISDKIIAKIDLFYIDNQFAKTFNRDSSTATIVAKALKGLFDVNLGVEYRYTKRLGFFLNLNNLANARYYRYSNYPTQRINGMAGLSYSF